MKEITNIFYPNDSRSNPKKVFYLFLSIPLFCFAKISFQIIHFEKNWFITPNLVKKIMLIFCKQGKKKRNGINHFAFPFPDFADFLAGAFFPAGFFATFFVFLATGFLTGVAF